MAVKTYGGSDIDYGDSDFSYIGGSMADRYWVANVSGTPANWNTAANWSTTSGGAGGAAVPGASDAVYFDGNGVSGCVVDAAVSVASMDMQAGYTGGGANDGHFDNATNDQAIAVAGALTGDNKEVSLGDNTWTVGGAVDMADVTTLNKDASTILLSGAGAATQAVTFGAHTINAFTVNDSGATKQLSATLNCGAYTITAGNLTDNGQTVNVDGNLSIADASGLYTSTGILNMAGNGTIANPHSSNVIADFRIAASITTDMTADFYCNKITTGASADMDWTAGALRVITTGNDFLDIGAGTTSEAFSAFLDGLNTNRTQKAINLPNLFLKTYATNNDNATLTMTGDWTLQGVQWMGGSSATDKASALTLDADTYNITYSDLLDLNPGANRYARIYFGSGTHSFKYIRNSAASGAVTYLDFETCTLNVQDDIDWTNCVVNPGTSTLDTDGTTAAQTIVGSGGYTDPGAGGETSVADAYIWTVTGSGGWLLSTDSWAVANNFTQSAGTLNGNGQDMSVGGNWLHTGGTYTAGAGTVTFNSSSGSHTITSNGQAFNHILMDNASTTAMALADECTCADYTMSSLGVLGIGNFDLNISGDWLLNGGVYFTAGTGTVVFSGNKNYSGNTITHKNITFDTGTRTLLGTIYFSGLVTIDGTASISSSIVLKANSAADLKVTGTGQITGAGTYQAANGSSITQNDGTFDVANFLIEDTHTGAGNGILPSTYDSAEVSFRNTGASAQTFTGDSGTYTFGGNVTFETTSTGGYTIANDTNDPNFVFQGDLTIVENSGTVTWTKGAGTITLSGAGSGTQTITTLAKVLEALVVNDSGATKELGSHLDVLTTTITAGTLDASASHYNITTGDWSNSGTFTYRKGTVTIDVTAAIDGTTTFYNFQCTTAGSTLTFDNTATFTVNAHFAMAGTDGSLVTLVSDSPGTQWDLVLAGTHNVAYVDVTDSDASGGFLVNAYNSIGGAQNNINWTFPADPLGVDGPMIGTIVDKIAMIVPDMSGW